MLEVYKNIRKLRKEMRMSQEKLAELTGYSDRSSIAKIEKGEVDIPQSKIMLFAKALEVSASELMGNDGIDASSNKHKDLFEFYYNALSPEHQKDALQYIKYLKNQEHQLDDPDLDQET